MLPLCFLPQKYLAYTSFASIAINIFIFIAIILNFTVELKSKVEPNICMMAFSTGNVTFVCSIVMAIGIHPIIMPMYEELEGRNVKKFSRSLMISSGFTWTLFMLFSSLGYLSYGTKTLQNFILNLPPTQWYTYVVQIGITLVVLFVYPMMMIPLVAPVKKKWMQVLIIFGMVGATTTICLFLDNLAVVNVITGAVSAFFFLGLFVSVVGWRMLGYNKWLMLASLIFGVTMGTLGLIFRDPDVGECDKVCLWKLNKLEIPDAQKAVESAAQLTQ